LGLTSEKKILTLNGKFWATKKDVGNIVNFIISAITERGRFNVNAVKVSVEGAMTRKKLCEFKVITG